MSISPGAQGSRSDRGPLIHYWFIQYNPLFFFSALSVLAGILLFSGELSRELAGTAWRHERMLLAGVLQCYELLLLLGAALLFRTPGQRRPAVILGLLAGVFFFDVTFQIESLVTVGEWTLLGDWGLLAVSKLVLVRWVFQLIVPRATLIFAVAASAVLAATPALLSLGLVDATLVHLVGTWATFGLVGAVLGQRTAIGCRLTLDGWGQTVLRRSVRAVYGFWIVLSLAHLSVLAALHQVQLGPGHLAAVVLLLPVVVTDEVRLWIIGFSVIGLSSLAPESSAPLALAIGVAYLWSGARELLPRLWIGSVTALYVCAWTGGWSGGPLPEPPWALAVVGALVLAVLAWRMRLASAAAVAPMLVLLPPLARIQELGDRGWGMALLVAGFYSLTVGVALNWRAGRARAKEPATHGSAWFSRG